MSFNPADIIILLCFIPAVIGGLMKGFIRQAAGVAALILGIWGGYHFSALLSDKIKVWIHTDPQWLNIISFAIIFIGVLILVNLAGKLIAGVFKLALLGWLDKLLGVVFAIIKYAFILSVVIYLLNSLDNLFEFLPKETLEKSRLYAFVSKVAPAIFPYLKNLVS